MKTPFDYTNIPANVVRYSLKHGKSPTGACDCSAAGYLASNGEYYICDKCKKSVPHRRYGNDKVTFYGRAGSNIHRTTGKYVDCHHLDSTNYVLHF